MSGIPYTDEQKQAIKTIDRSVLVTAAAGSGKTAVLAGRCAYLVCDAPRAQRCSVDQLLVVTFTEAAASEMRSRVYEAIAERLADRPHDGELRKQLALIDTAQISTIHAFCLWMVRRWFNLVDVEPAATVLDEDEARLIQAETIETLFGELYESDTPTGNAFRELVEQYGLGRDAEIRKLVLDLAAYVTSLCDPNGWLDDAAKRVCDPTGVTGELTKRLSAELTLQHEECDRLARYLLTRSGPGAFYGRLLEEYAHSLWDWRQRLGASGFDAVQAEIDSFALSSKGATCVPKDAPLDQVAMRDEARDHFEDVRDRFFKKRLRGRFGRFSSAELEDGLRRIAPHVRTIVGLVRAFGLRYASAKRAVSVLDFADLERCAYRLLTRSDGDVAGVLRRRFAHVLIDEFQDVNPLQEGILRRVSREEEADARGNLFVVGDAKQSIYAFRMAEPGILLNRERAFDADSAAGACIRLQENYRSRRTVLDGVNLLFRSLMRQEVAAIEYDDRAALRCGRRDFDISADTPIEVHLLQRRVAVEDEDDEAPRFVDPSDPTQWTPSEREAYLIGTRIREILSNGETLHGGAPVRYGDVAVLLRAASHTAAPMADVLRRMGIPAYADARGALFEALEVQDVLSLLEVLDNPQQDIPLAAVLRSPILGDSFREDDLVSIRVIDRDVPFHEAVRLYARRGTDPALRDRVQDFLCAVGRYRVDIRQRPVADVLWRIYQETGYLGYAGGLTNGAQRRANLLKLHERARQFGTFQRQGLHRFLRFIDSLKDEDQDFGAAPSLSESDNVVRIMTIHRSKGLEFPVVFLAGLGRRFNLEDAGGRLVYDRRAGIGLRVVDRERMIEYPSAVHHLAADNIQNSARAEELRILYVAMTRAKERLILTGSMDPGAIERARRYGSAGASGLSAARILSAGTPLDWIVPVLAGAPPTEVNWAGEAESGQAGGEKYRVTLHTEDEIRNWRLEKSDGTSEISTLEAAGELEALPVVEPAGVYAEEADALVERIDFVYPHLAESSVRAVVAASELKRPFDVLADPDEQTRERYRQPTGFEVPGLGQHDSKDLTTTQRGTATHVLLQHIRLEPEISTAYVESEARRLVEESRLTAADSEAINVESIVWFFSTPLGERVRAAGAGLRREVMFLSSEPAETFDRTIGPSCDIPVVVRGIVDGVLVEDGGLELIDYKTDRIEPAEVTARAASYALQMRLYARAMARCWRREVRGCWLVFLHPRTVVPVAHD